MTVRKIRRVFVACFMVTCLSCHRNLAVKDDTLATPEKTEDLSSTSSRTGKLKLLCKFTRQMSDSKTSNIELGSTGKLASITYKVSEKPLGKGGEGVIFEVTVTDGDSSHAIALKKLAAPDMEEIVKQSTEIAKNFPPDEREERKKKMIAYNRKARYKMQESESEALQKLSGTPGIVGYCGSFRDQAGNFYISLEKMDGLFKGPFTPEVFKTMVKILLAMKAKDIVHNDISPGNVLIKNGEPYLSDFGAATDSKAARERDSMGGTPFFIAPERANHDISLEDVDVFKTDLFSLGLVLLVWKRPDLFESAKEELMPGLPESDTPPLDAFALNVRSKYAKIARDPYDDLIVRMIDPDINSRIDAERLADALAKI